MSVIDVIRRLAAPAADPTSDAYEWLVEHGLPTQRDEAWRYTPVSRISGVDYHPGTPAPTVGVSQLRELLGASHGPRIVCINGVFSAEHSTLERLAMGLRCVDLGPGPHRPELDVPRVDGYRLLNDIAGVGGAAILLTADTRLEEPVEVVHLTVPGDEPTMVHPRTHIDARGQSRLVVIERYLGLPGVGLTNAVTTIVAGPGAQVVHQRIVDGPTEADHLGHTSVRMNHEASLCSTSVMIGGRIARSATDVVLHGDEAVVELRGLSLCAGHQQHDQLATVEHAGSRGVSDQRFTAVADHHAHSSFGGHVLVQPATAGTVATQMSRSLVLSDTAEVTTRPWLEIQADDVRCTHGATVGRLSDEALFYLRSRGIPRTDARRMLITAFIREVIDEIEPTWLRAELDSRIDRALAPEEIA
jgi:Fe-S cluster assembly protein SufD